MGQTPPAGISRAGLEAPGSRPRRTYKLGLREPEPRGEPEKPERSATEAPFVWNADPGGVLTGLSDSLL